jgi:hypothetical protein
MKSEPPCPHVSWFWIGGYFSSATFRCTECGEERTTTGAYPKGPTMTDERSEDDWIDSAVDSMGSVGPTPAQKRILKEQLHAWNDEQEYPRRADEADLRAQLAAAKAEIEQRKVNEEKRFRNVDGWEAKLAASAATIAAINAEVERLTKEADFHQKFAEKALNRCCEQDATIAAQAAEIERLKAACIKQQHDIQQTLGKALCYPPYPREFEAGNLVCVGEHVAETLADEAAAELAKLREQGEEQRRRLDRCCGIYFQLPGECATLHLHRTVYTNLWSVVRNGVGTQESLSGGPWKSWSAAIEAAIAANWLPSTQDESTAKEDGGGEVGK